jgi:hypothetical protein
MYKHMFVLGVCIRGRPIDEILLNDNWAEDRGSWSGGKYRLANWTHDKIHMQDIFTDSRAIYFRNPKIHF